MVIKKEEKYICLQLLKNYLSRERERERERERGREKDNKVNKI